MTDFVRDLEAELLAAARRRAARRRAWWTLPRAGGRRPAALLAVAALAAVAAAVLVPRPAPDERPAPSGPPGAFAVPALAASEVCGTGGALPGSPPGDAAALLDVLRRASRPGDQLPRRLRNSASQWLPAGDWSGRSRRPAAMLDPVLVLGANDVRTRPAACEDSVSRGPGACLVAPRDRGRPRVRCFTVAEIREGRAFAVERGRLVGLVPDDILRVELTVRGRTQGISVVENAVQRAVTGLRPGAEIAIRLLEHRTNVTVVGEREPAERVARQIEALGLRTEVIINEAGQLPPGFDARNPTYVVPLRPGAGELAERIRRLLGAGRGSIELPARKGRVTPSTPDVIVHVRTR